MTKAKEPNIFVSCISVLGAICLVITAALAIVNHVTEPVIAAGTAERAERARIEVLPAADGFELLELSGLPERVSEVYKASNGAGYVFMLSTKGYGGEISMLCGIDSEGLITAAKVLSHTETAGLGTKVTTDAAYGSQYIGQDSSLSGVQAISGATISSNAYKAAIEEAFTAYQIAKEAE